MRSIWEPGTSEENTLLGSNNTPVCSPSEPLRYASQTHIPPFSNQVKIPLPHSPDKDRNTLLKAAAPNSKLVGQYLASVETIPGIIQPTHPSCHLVCWEWSNSVTWFLNLSVTTLLCKGHRPHAVGKVSWEVVQTQSVFPLDLWSMCCPCSFQRWSISNS